MDVLKSSVETLVERLPDLAAVQFYSETDSTNLQAMALGRNGAAVPQLVVADAQTAGRGRRGRPWESTPGLGLYFSLLIKPELPLAQAPLLTLATGLAVQQALNQLEIKSVMIKWPNDILISGKKICGILSEVESQGSQLLFVVLGIGLNVHQQVQDFSKELKDTAGSLSQVCAQELKRETLLEKILHQLFKEIKALESGKISDLIKRWENHSGFIGKTISVQQSDGTVIGEVLGLNDSGHLLLKTEAGKTITLISEDTTLL